MYRGRVMKLACTQSKMERGHALSLQGQFSSTALRVRQMQTGCFIKPHAHAVEIVSTDQDGMLVNTFQHCVRFAQKKWKYDISDNRMTRDCTPLTGTLLLVAAAPRGSASISLFLKEQGFPRTGFNFVPVTLRPRLWAD